MDRQEAEYNAIGVLLNDDARYIDKIENFYLQIQPKYFENDVYKIFYDTMRSLRAKGKPANIIEIAEAVKSLNIFEKDVDALKTVLEKTRDNAAFMADSLETFSEAILGGYMQSRIKSLVNSTNDTDEVMKALERLLDEVNESVNGINDGKSNSLDYLESGYSSELEKYLNTKEIPTGFKELDALLSSKGGLLPERLYILGAIPSLGKTTLIHQIADNIAANGTPVLFFSLEQSRFELVTKSLAREEYKLFNKSRKNGETMKSAGLLMKTGIVSEADKAAFNSYLNTSAANMNVYEGNFNTTVDTITATVKRFKRTNRKTPVLIVDYLQILRPSDQSGKTGKTKEIYDDIVNGLKILARNEMLPVIAISSFNRGSYAKQATFEAYKETGSIEYSADVVLALQLSKLNELTTDTKDVKVKADNAKALEEEKRAAIRRIDLVCLKNRGGNCFTLQLGYKPQYEYFTDDTKELKEWGVIQ